MKCAKFKIRGQHLDNDRSKPDMKMLSNESEADPAATRGRRDPWSLLLVALARERDENVFQTLYNYFAPRVKSYALRGGCSYGLAEEVAQETLITVWQKSHMYNPELAMASTWIFTIARNKKIDKLRKLGKPVPRKEDMYIEFTDMRTPEDNTQNSQNALHVHTALSRLPKGQRQVLQLAFIEENPHKTIAKLLGVPLGTVKSRIRLGLEKLSVELATLKKDFE